MTPFLSYICVILFMLFMMVGAAAILTVIFSAIAFIYNLFLDHDKE